MISIREIKEKIAAGDLGNLLLHGKKIHPSEVATIFNSLPVEAAVAAFRDFPIKRQIYVFAYLSKHLQQEIIRKVTPQRGAYILNQLSSDDRLNVVESFKGIERSHLIEQLDEKKKAAIHDMMGYPKNSVARLINTDFATISGNMTIAEATEHLQANHADSETANVIYVVNEAGELLDDIPVRRMVLNKATKHVSEIMDGYCVKLLITDTADDAVTKFQEYDRTVLPVTNTSNILLGVVTVDDVMDVAEARSTREMQKFGGLEGLDYPYVKTPFFSLVRKRGGWLIVLFLSEMLTASAMGYFQVEIEKAVVLSLFVPLVMSSGGNSGSQAATLIIRALAVKELTLRDWFYVMRRELLAGLTLGVILGSVGFLRLTIWHTMHWDHSYHYGTHWLLMAATIFFSLIGIVMWGTLSGAMIPMVLKKLKQDPATSSAPFVATLVDVTGLIIYFAVAAFILRGTLL